MKVTTDDLLEALQQALAKPEHGDHSTFEELEERTGLGIKKLRKSLKTLALQGRLDVTPVYRADISGRLQPKPGYRIKP